MSTRRSHDANRISGTHTLGVTQANGPRGGPTGAVRAGAVELSDGVYQGGIEAQVEGRRIETTALLRFGSSLAAAVRRSIAAGSRSGGSYDVTARSTDSSPSALAGVFLPSGDGSMLFAYREALTSSSVASRARLETPSLA